MTGLRGGVGDHPVDMGVLYSMLHSARRTTHYSSFPLTQYMVDCLYLTRHPLIRTIIMHV